MYASLPKKILSYEVSNRKFNHLDFLWAIDAPKLVYEQLLDSMAIYK